MNKEALLWQNKAAEAERSRQAIANKANQMERHIAEMRRALEEARQFADGKREYKDNEVVALRNMLRAAIAYRPTKEPAKILTKGLELFASDPPKEPETDDWFYDGKYLNWYYLGRWHRERIEE